MQKIKVKDYLVRKLDCIISCANAVGQDINFNSVEYVMLLPTIYLRNSVV